MRDTSYNNKRRFLFLIISLMLLIGAVPINASSSEIDDVPLKEIREMGYRDYKSLQNKFASCIVANLKGQSEEESNACNLIGFIFMCGSTPPPNVPATTIAYDQLLDYINSFKKSCFETYPATDPITSDLKIEQICACAAQETLKHTSSDTYMRMMHGEITEEIINDGIFSAHCARIRCANSVNGTYYRE